MGVLKDPGIWVPMMRSWTCGSDEVGGSGRLYELWWVSQLVLSFWNYLRILTYLEWPLARVYW